MPKEAESGWSSPIKEWAARPAKEGSDGLSTEAAVCDSDGRKDGSISEAGEQQGVSGGCE